MKTTLNLKPNVASLQINLSLSQAAAPEQLL